MLLATAAVFSLTLVQPASSLGRGSLAYDSVPSLRAARLNGRMPAPRAAVAEAPSKEAVVAATVVARNKRYEGLLVGGLAFFAGVSDVLCQSHYNCFANMMTGNVIWTMTALSRAKWLDARFYLSVVLTYVVGIAVYRTLDMRRQSAASRPAAALGALLLLFAARDLAAWSLPGTRWHVLLCTVGFAFINAISAEELGTVTCMITGHAQKVGNSLAELLAGNLRALGQDAFLRSVSVLVTFAAGVAAGTASLGVGGGPWVGGLLKRAPFTLLAASYAAAFAVYDRLLASPPPELAVALGPCDLDPIETECTTTTS